MEAKVQESKEQRARIQQKMLSESLASKRSHNLDDGQGRMMLQTINQVVS